VLTALTFMFEPRWKEELVCSCGLGSFVLEMPMGTISVLLPTQSLWEQNAPTWARPHWEALRTQLAKWCAQYRYPLYIDASATVY
jgi:hypothetical protein